MFEEVGIKLAYPRSPLPRLAQGGEGRMEAKEGEGRMEVEGGEGRKKVGGAQLLTGSLRVLMRTGPNRHKRSHRRRANDPYAEDSRAL